MSKSRLQKLPFDYAWIILAILFLGLLASFGVRASFGAYMAPWEQAFSVNRTVITSISMLSFIVYAIGQPLAGKLDDHFGGRVVLSGSLLLVGASLLLSSQATHLWELFLYYGVGLSLGVAGCSNVTVAAIITRWFAAKRGFALGLALSGMAVGQLIVVPTALLLINKYSWRTSLLAAALLILVIVTPLMFAFLRSKPKDIGLKPLGSISKFAEEDSQHSETANPMPRESIFTIFKLRIFWQLVIPYFICGFTDVGLIGTHYIPLTQGKGFSVSIVALTFSLIAVFNIFGTIATGYMSDHFNRSRQLGIIYAIRAGTLIFLLTIKNPWLLVLFTIIYGATEMASIAPTSSLSAQLFEKYSLGTVLGFVSVGHQLGGAIGSWIPGVLYDYTGSYNLVIILSVNLLIGSAILVTRVPEPRYS